MNRERTILLVEDNEDDVLLMRRSLKTAGLINPLFIVEDGQKALDYMAGTGVYADRLVYPLPSVVFLDLKLPFKTGHEVLAWIKSRPEYAEVIVVILTSSNQQKDVEEAYRLKANSYVVKPPTTTQLVEMAKAFKQYWIEFNYTPSS